uniref:Putative secreted protein n=1 Tax=Ixodes ricinus TaxID=34613 RepID=A0A147BBT7_IXORI
MALFAFATFFMIFLVLGLVLVNLRLKQGVSSPPPPESDVAGDANATSVANQTDRVGENATEPAWMWIDKRKVLLPVQPDREVSIVTWEYTTRSSTPRPPPRTAVARTPRIALSTRGNRPAVVVTMELPKAKNDQPPQARTGPQTRSRTRVASLAATASATVRTASTLDDGNTTESPSVGNDQPEARTGPRTTNQSWTAGLAASSGATGGMSSIVDGAPTVDIPTERTTSSRFNESTRGWALANTSGRPPSPTSGSGSTSPIWSTSSASSSSFGRWLAEEHEADPTEAATKEAMTSKAAYDDALLTDAAWTGPALSDAGLTGAVWTAALLTGAAASTSASASTGPSTSTDASSTEASSTNATTSTLAVLADEGSADADRTDKI